MHQLSGKPQAGSVSEASALGRFVSWFPGRNSKPQSNLVVRMDPVYPN